MEESDSENVTSDSEGTCSSSSTASYENKKKKKGSLPKKPIAVVGQILKKLVEDDIHVLENKSSKRTKIKARDFFCIEDTFLTKDLEINIEGIGQISFPLNKDCVEQMIKLSSKAKFGKGKKTLLDTNVRDTQTIPASKLKIQINNSSLDDLLRRIGTGLNVGVNCKLIPHLHNLLIYGPGQFFKKHTDSEKMQNMIATLVIILPYPHEGGELVIEHNEKKHMFFGSKNPDIAKCVAFYSDCAHEIKKVTDGYRVAITYNVVLQPPDIPDVAEISAEIKESLDTAVEDFFKSGKVKLVFGLNHSYSQKSLKWNLLKGADRSRVNALLEVAKKQGRIPCLALTTYHEIYDRENTYYCPSESPVLVDEETEINFMIDENNTEIKCSSGDDVIHENTEFCCTRKAKELFKPYETEFSGPTGNEGDTEEYWYRRACLVLWSSKWVYTGGFKEALGELHGLTNQDGMQEVLIKKINEAREYIDQSEKWAEPSIAEMILDIVTYLVDENEAKFFLGDLCKYIMNEDRINRLVQLEKMFNDQILNDIVKIWKCKGYHSEWNNVVDKAHLFIDKYMELVGTQFKSVIVYAILKDGVNKFIESEEQRSVSKYVYNRKRKESIETLRIFMKICALLGEKSLQESLINHVVGSSYPAVSLGELYTKLMDDLEPEQIALYETIRDLAEKGINARLSELKNETGWGFPIKVSCSCKVCSPVVKFFTETSNKSHVIVCTKKNSDHLFSVFYSGLNMFSLPCKWSHDRDGRNHKVTFEKLPRLLEDRKELNEDLVRFKDKIESVQLFSYGDIKVENEDEFGEDYSNIEITENVKIEMQDDVGLFPQIEQVTVKSEVVEQADVSNCGKEEVPKKRPKNK